MFPAIGSSRRGDASAATAAAKRSNDRSSWQKGLPSPGRACESSLESDGSLAQAGQAERGHEGSRAERGSALRRPDLRPPIFRICRVMSPTGQPQNPSPPSKPETVSDAELASRCRAGDVRAFEALYRQHAGRLFAVACRLAGSVDTAEDLLQEIFLQAFKKLETYKGDAALGTWLYRLAINCCLDYLRSRSVKNAKLTGSFEDLPLVAPLAPRDAPVERIDLDRAIAQLPDGYREAFVLHDVEGFDHKEVARLLGVAEGTSKSQVFKARLKLRALLSSRR